MGPKKPVISRSPYSSIYRGPTNPSYPLIFGHLQGVSTRPMYNDRLPGARLVGIGIPPGLTLRCSRALDGSVPLGLSASTMPSSASAMLLQARLWLVGWLGLVGWDEVLPKYVGMIIVNHYKDPY